MVFRTANSTSQRSAIVPTSRECIRVLLVEDHLGEADLVMENLANAGVAAFKVTHVGTVYSAVRLLSEDRFDVVLLDLSLPDSYGLETVVAVREVNARLPIVVISGIRNPRLPDQACRWGVERFLNKDEIDADLLASTLQRAVEH